ncbi:MAG: transposase [Candidatus Thiodiazotropha sp. (ex Codakia orbicularis)]|nr:transposase [Candidatus Thiodiazotropha sp. (ex Codakia orbicularis)]
MPRKPRFNLIGIPQHVIQRGNNREPCFFSEQDYFRYLDDLTIASNKYGCKVHAYVLMTNHVHLLLTPTQEHGISNCMQALGRRYVRFINHKYQRSGTLWEGRYRSSLIDSDSYLLNCMRYIELNPIRAKIVTHPFEYKWSSYVSNALGKNNILVTAHPSYLALGHTPESRQSSYRELFRHQPDDHELREIRDTLNHELVLGRSWFKCMIEEMTNRRTCMGKPGRPRIEEEIGVYCSRNFVY